MTLRFNVLLVCCFFISTLELTNAKTSKCASQFALRPDLKCGPKEKKTKKYCKGTRFQNAFSVSSDGPIAAAASPKLTTEVAYFQRLFHNISIDVVRKRRRFNLQEKCPFEDDIMDDGAHRRHDYETQRDWKFATIRHQKRIGLKYSNSTCFTHIKLGVEKSKDVFSHLLNFRDELHKAGRAMLKEAKKPSAIPNYFKKRIKCFDDVYTPIYRNIKTDDFMCTIIHSPAMRWDSKYFLNVALTSEPLNYNLEKKNRLYLGEYWDVDENSKLRALNASSYRYRQLSPVITNTTTTLFTWGGAVKVSQFMNIAPVNGPAMQYILESSEKERDALGEGIFPSNIAILVFPAVLGALIPSSFFEMIGKLGYQIIYGVITDVLAVLPLAIKGVEMIAFTKEILTRCVAWNMGAELKSGLAVTELWCASCKHHSIYRTYGYAFLIASISLMLTGFIIEILAYRWTWKRRRHLEMHSNRYWYQEFCPECRCTTSEMTTADESSWSVPSTSHSSFDPYSKEHQSFLYT